MEKKVLNNIDTEHFVYLKVGDHNHEPLKAIIDRKVKEAEACGFSLWAFTPQRKSLERRLAIINECSASQNSEGYVYALFFDGGDDPKSDGTQMHHYESNGEILPIPEEIYVTASGKNGDYALVVDQYFEVDGDNTIYGGEYDKIPSFGFEILHKTGTEKTRAKKVAYIARLKAPFIVKVLP